MGFKSYFVARLLSQTEGLRRLKGSARILMPRGPFLPYAGKFDLRRCEECEWASLRRPFLPPVECQKKGKREEGKISTRKGEQELFTYVFPTQLMSHLCNVGLL